MKLDPHIKVDRLLTAIPSSALVFQKFGITVAGNEDNDLEQACADRGIGLEEFEQAIDDIDWNEESAGTA